MLSPEQRRRLECLLQETRSARIYRRTLALLEYGRGRSVTEIADALGLSRQTVYNWLSSYARYSDAEALDDAARPGRPRLWTEEHQALLRTLLATSPDRLGYFALNWTVPLLREQIEHTTGCRLCQNTIRNALHREGYAWKRPRYQLQPDPDREKKTLAAEIDSRP
jgi:transposase